MWYNKRQSLSTTTVLFKTTFSRTIDLNLLLKWLLGSNLSQFMSSVATDGTDRHGLKIGPTFSSFLMPCLEKLPKYCYGPCFPTKLVWCLLLKYTQGHPITVFCEISGRSSKNCLEFSIAWGRLKLSRWTFHSCAIFEAYLINSLWFSEV